MAAIFDESWPRKELKERMRRITRTLRRFLPEDFRDALAVLLPVAPQFSGFEFMFFPEFVELYGIDDFEASVPALEAFTPYSSSEFAVRPFIVRYGAPMMEQMERWTGHENEHVRRLASEGCRPRLPWAMALPQFKKDPAPVLQVLRHLKEDPSEYVRRSVANNLNDISKDHPDVTLDIAEQWLGISQETDKLCKHACRTLLKKGNVRAMRLFDYGAPEHVSISNFSAPQRVRMGETIEFSFTLLSSSGALGKLRVEYGMDFLKANAGHYRKVFMVSEKEHSESGKDFTRKYSFVPRTTRKHYPGLHRITVIVNGAPVLTHEFTVSS